MFVQYLNTLKKKAPNTDLFLKQIVQVRKNDFFAIWSLLIHEQFLFLRFFRSCVSQGPGRRQKPDQHFEQGEFNVANVLNSATCKKAENC